MITKYKLFLESKDHSDMWNSIPNSIKELHKIFNDNGKKLYLVGGCVRDFLNNDKPKDFDLATDALPNQILDILKGKYQTNLQGKAFGVIVVYTQDQPLGMEIATFRQDTTRGRNPEVKLGVTIDDDVQRRDLTYNALFYDLDKKEIVDLVGGVNDINNKITRMVGKASERIDEDSLRILRAFRFASRYETPLDDELSQAIIDRKIEHPITRLENYDPVTDKIIRISQERVWEEFKKAWGQAKNFNHYLNFFTYYDMWKEAFTNIIVNTNQINSKNFIVVLANLLLNEDTNGLLKRMVENWKIETDTATKVILLIDLLKLNENNVVQLYKQKQRCHIDVNTIIEWYKVRNIKDSIFEAFLQYKPSVSADDLMKKGFKAKALGDEIERLEVEEFKKLINDL